MTDPLIIPIRGPQIYYLDRNHLSQCLDVTLVSQSGEKIRVNKLQLAAFSHDMFDADDFEEDAVITTNLDLNDLSLVANFITEGLLPMPEKALKSSIPSEIANVFLSFGITLDQLLNNVQKVKDEHEPLKAYSFKDEPLGTVNEIYKIYLENSVLLYTKITAVIC